MKKKEKFLKLPNPSAVNREIIYMSDHGATVKEIQSYFLRTFNEKFTETALQVIIHRG